jgi:diguanylate cyclase (GGDEF)-like protein
MAGNPESLQIQQLVELLAVVSSFPDETTAVQGAVERAAQALEAEVAAVVLADRVAASIGFPAGAVPDDDVLAVTRHELDHLDVPGLGTCHATSAMWAGTHPGHLMLARWGDDPFSVEERNLVRGMARVLELTLTMLRTLRAEHQMRERLEERQRLLEHLFEIQRAISRRRPLQQILDAITRAAQDLFGDEIVGLWVRDASDAGLAKLASSVGLRRDLAKRLPALSISDAGEAGEAISVDGVVSRHGEAEVSAVIGRLAGRTPYASLAAPVHESGTVTGSLVVASCLPGREYNSADEQTLRAFAEHVSLALTDATTVDRMRQAFHDSLTGLASRGLFLERMTQMFAAAGSDGAQVALLFVDLDRFKAVNDTLGHAAGDQVLMVTGERIKSQLRAGDLAGRFGGDEFAVLMAQVYGEAEAVAVAERLCAALSAPVIIGGRHLDVNASVGIALGTPGQTDPSGLMRCADIAMYQAKRSGRGRYELYSEQMERAFAGGAVA